MNSNRLKWTALVLMFIDHIGEFIPKSPIIFRWIGRISAPIFLYCCAWSFDNTKDKKKYLLRLYVFSLIMAIINCFLDVQNNFFRTLFSLCIIFYIINIYKEKKKFVRYVIIYLLYQCLSIIITILLINYSFNSYMYMTNIAIYIVPALLGNFFNLEGGLVFVLLGITFYCFKNYKYKLVIAYFIFDFIYFFLSTTSIISIVLGKINAYGLYNVTDYIEYTLNNIIGLGPIDLGGSFLFQNYQWMMIFSLFLILLYNGERGKKQKWLFYIFYPTHIIVLFFVGNLF